jgi:hypothetical protein
MSGGFGPEVTIDHKGGNRTFAAICTNVCSAEDLAPTGAIPKAAFAVCS